MKVLQDNKILKLHRMSALHLNAVDHARVNKLVELRNSEQERIASKLVTDLKEDD